MKLVNMIETLRTKTVKKIAYGILVLLVMVDFIIPRHEVHFFGDKIPGFWSLFGFSACVVIIIVSKWLGKNGLMKDEDYYD
ncbi:MAG TPA: hypothetical protein EYI98_04170 [Candidatus Marinimicrobia bacterium]|jgi:hypothetical protein|nr:MAG: hypothetical protein COC11_00085 [Candidatus Neomarinimicrobiota bacterium]HIB14109.1 hypothetical protein [Candidatus Neomarinimicrobiota bacterium]HIM27184.1 hypothetical protein [Candidatus Neomarinimicrobiota bacterium]|tara:strand:- start:211 stop:453 length:243 start_codon:yes stop_codon:yes gene_type:complete